MATQALDRVAAQATEEYEKTLEDVEPKYQTEIDIEPTEEKDEENMKLDKEDLEEVQEKAKDKPKKSKKKDNDIMANVDNDFYTKSMDLSDKDFAMSDEFDDEEGLPIIMKILIVLIILAGIAAAGYYLYMNYFK